MANIAPKSKIYYSSLIDGATMVAVLTFRKEVEGKRH